MVISDPNAGRKEGKILSELNVLGIWCEGGGTIMDTPLKLKFIGAAGYGAVGSRVLPHRSGDFLGEYPVTWEGIKKRGGDEKKTINSFKITDTTAKQIWQLCANSFCGCRYIQHLFRITESMGA